MSPISSSLNVCTIILDSPTEPCEDSALIRNLYLTPGCNPVFFEAESNRGYGVFKLGGIKSEAL